MAKQAKVKQTDWTKQGKSIADTSVPLYKEALKMQGDYLSNPQQYLDDYLNKYWSNNANQSDFLRQYNRAMSNTTANNYAATTGGYTSAGQRAYDDQQRYQNDLASRLQTQGIQGASNLVGDWYNRLNTGLGNYNTAYGLGENYSKIDQYNDLINQERNNWIGSALNGAGNALMSSNNPWAQAIGGTMVGASGIVGTDTSNAKSWITGSNKSAGAGGSSGVDPNSTWAQGVGGLMNTDWSKMFGGFKK